MMVVLVVMTIARTGTIPQLPDLPHTYLPGNRLPEAVSCYTVNDEHVPRCSITHLDTEIHFVVDPETDTIIGAVVPALDYTVGELIMSWGTPDGIIQTPQTTYVHWGTRTAHIFTGSLQPDSRVQFVHYEAQPKSTSPWRGFRRRNDGDA
jgi:hypothetical protein